MMPFSSPQTILTAYTLNKTRQTARENVFFNKKQIWGNHLLLCFAII
jgi:hypothetical protein